MSVDQFLKLKELDSLTKMRRHCLDQKKDQEDRVSKLQERFQDESLQTTKLKQSLVSSQTELAALEQKIKQASLQKQRLMDIGGSEEKILAFSEEINKLEEGGLLLLERIDHLIKELEDNRTFLSGLEKTLSEIHLESQEEIKRLQQELQNTNLRIQSLLEDLPLDFRSTYDKVAARNLAHGPFTRVDQGSCFFCRYQISRVDESQVDKQKELKCCRQCERIFLPYGS